LEERYGTHEGYVDAVRKATKKLVKDRLLLPADAARLISEAGASDLGLPPGEPRHDHDDDHEDRDDDKDD
jgi:hypothetical protein